MLHDDYLCLVESGKQQIKEVRRKFKRKTRKQRQLLSESGFVLRIAPPSLSRDRRIKMKKSIDVQFSAQNQFKTQKKRSSRPQMSNFLPKIKWRPNKRVMTSAGRIVVLKLPKFFVKEWFNMFLLFVMPKRRAFWHFLATSSDNFFFSLKGGYVPQQVDV